MVRKQVDINFIYNILNALTPSATHIYLSDNQYWLCSETDIKTFLSMDATNKDQYIAEEFDCEVPTETAYGLGLFFADGSCGLREEGKYAGAFWRIVGWKLDCLERVKKAFEQQWQDMAFPIRLYDDYKIGSDTNYGTRKKDLYCLEVAPRIRHNDSSRGKFIEKFRVTNYSQSANKKVPAGILESPSISKRAFLQGVIDGDGTVIKDHPTSGSISCHGKMQLSELMDLMIDCGWKINQIRKDNGNDNYRLPYNYKEEKLSLTPACDDFSYRLMGQLSIPEWSGIAFGIVWTNLHALNCFIDDKGKFWFIEPQSDKLQDKLEAWQGTEILFILM